MLLRELVRASAEVRATRSRKRKSAALAECIRQMAVDELVAGVSFLTGVIPGGKIGVGWAAVKKARQAEAAAESTLTVASISERFADIANTHGTGSAAKRTGLLGAMFHAARADEQQFLAHLLMGEMRQGASEGVMADALAQAADVSSALVRRAAMLCGDLGAVATAAMTEGSAGLERFSLQLFRPVLPMLAQPADDVVSALDTIEDAVVELKLDGARVQVHKDGDQIRVYSRRLNDVTAAVPELVAQARALPARRLILDGEAIALRDDGTPYPFQQTMRRFGRRRNSAADQDTLPLTAMYFDCLLVDDDDLMDRGGRDRAQALTEALPTGALVPRLETNDTGAAEEFWARAIAQGHEGVMIKSLASAYEAGRRGKHWFKIKPAHTLDLVVIAVEWGSGRRKGWLSNLHLAARDPQTNSFVMLGKTFKGMTDAMLTWQTKRLLELELSRDEHVVHVKPELVAEIAFNDVLASPHYPGGMALRFARVKRYRKDKRADDADTITTVRQIFERGQGKK